MSTRTAEAPLRVFNSEAAQPFIVVAANELDLVVQSLRDENIPLSVDKDALMVDGRPALRIIDLVSDADVERAQGVLDRISADRRRKRGAHFPPSPRKFLLKGAQSDIEEVLRRIQLEIPGEWTRRKDLEQRMRKLRSSGENSYCLVKELEPDHQKYAVWIEPRGPGELHITSIIPLLAHAPLSVARHNEILEDIEKTLFEPLTRGLRIRPISYEVPTKLALEDVLPTESMSLLRRFSDTANKSMLHPLDALKWSAFVARTHIDNVVLDATLLADWLQREGWPERQRLQLVEEYEYGRSLLTVYNEERAEQ